MFLLISGILAGESSGCLLFSADPGRFSYAQAELLDLILFQSGAVEEELAEGEVLELTKF